MQTDKKNRFEDEKKKKCVKTNSANDKSLTIFCEEF